jgi:hypothetical protein
VIVGIVVVVLLVIGAGLLLGLSRRPRQDEGMATFRRHIDALSPEARRDVMDRARRHEQERN